MHKSAACYGLFGVFIGCGGASVDHLDSATAGPDDACGVPEDTVVLVITSLHFTRETSPTESEGFDLDRVSSTNSDRQGCGHADYTSADGTAGIDNAFAALVPVLESIGAGAVESLINDAINLHQLVNIRNQNQGKLFWEM